MGNIWSCRKKKLEKYEFNDEMVQAELDIKREKFYDAWNDYRKQVHEEDRAINKHSCESKNQDLIKFNTESDAQSTHQKSK